MIKLSSLLSLALTCSTLPVADEPTLAERLERLVAELEDARVEAHVPGMSLAVVKDGEVVLARGFGLADVESERLADEGTIYAIGSTTKAFTATLVGMLVDEGKASWDAPVTDYLPYFELPIRSEDDGAYCTLRDLLSHRHGFARMGILWVSGTQSREEILRTAVGAEPLDDFRKGFHYCNVTYLAAGEAAGAADGTSWDEMMVARVFEPLGMTSSTLTRAAAQEDPRLAFGYEWNEVDEVPRRLEMVELAAIGPAGSVNSNVVDMARWVTMLLGEGEIDDMRLVSETALRETWSPQVAIGGGTSYGMGWMLREHGGHRVVEHGGNINGFSAEVCLVPDEGLGFVLLTNLDVAPLQAGSVPIVIDALLGAWPEPRALAEGEIDYDEYLGVYVANFATFSDEEFEVRRTDDGIALHIPSQTTYALKDPDAEGKWVFALTDQIAVEFQRDDSGAVVALVLHQGGFAFEVPRQGFEREPDAPLDELEEYVGTYVLEAGSKRLEFSVEGGRLTMNDDGKKVELHVPDEEGHAPLRPYPAHGATFERDAEGRVVALVFHGNAGDRRFERVREEEQGVLPTLEELLALRDTEARAAARADVAGVRATGTIRIAQAGVEGALTIHTDGGRRHAVRADFGGFGHTAVAVDGEQVWVDNPLRGRERLNGDEALQAMLDHPGAIEGDWREFFDEIEVVRREPLDERDTVVVRLTREGLPSRSYWVDAENGDVLQVKQITIERSVRVPVTVTLSDYFEQDGIRTARTTVSENPASGRTILTIESIETGLELGDEDFRLSSTAEED